MNSLNHILKLQFIIFISLTLILTNGCSTIIGTFVDHPIKPYQGKYNDKIPWLNDQTIETISEVNIRKSNPMFKDARIKVVSINSTVLILGQVPTEKLKKQALKVAKEIPQIKKIYNYIEVTPTISIAQQAHDAWITTTIKTKLIKSKKVVADDVSVITENNTVYLVGNLTPLIAQDAAEIASKTSEVKKVFIINLNKS